MQNQNLAEEVLRRDALGRVSISKDKREALLDEFERSGLKGGPFAKMAGVNYQTFASWIQRRRHERGDYPLNPKLPSKPLCLIEAVVDADSATSPAVVDTPRAISLVVRLPGGGSLELSDVTQVPVAVQLLQALRMSC